MEGPVKRVIRTLRLLGAALIFSPAGAAGQELNVGDLAPDFTLQASDGQTYSLSKLRGRTVVLAWFPKAFTAG
jgi:peroxiredoxin Q/BCP